MSKEKISSLEDIYSKATLSPEWIIPLQVAKTLLSEKEYQALLKKTVLKNMLNKKGKENERRKTASADNKGIKVKQVASITNQEPT